MLIYSNSLIFSQNLLYSNVFTFIQPDGVTNDCNNILKLLASIDCKLAELGNNLYNNISYLLNNNSDICKITKLLMYKQILLYKYNNSNYLLNWNLCEIGDAVRSLTSGCINKCFKPEDCYSQDY